MAKTKNGFATKQDLKKAVDTILVGIDHMLREQDERMEKKFATKEDLAKLAVEVSFIKDEIKGLKADLSDTVSHKQFEELKTKVEHYLSLTT